MSNTDITFTLYIDSVIYAHFFTKGDANKPKIETIECDIKIIAQQRENL